MIVQDDKGKVYEVSDISSMPNMYTVFKCLSSPSLLLRKDCRVLVEVPMLEHFDVEAAGRRFKYKDNTSRLEVLKRKRAELDAEIAKEKERIGGIV